MTVIPLSRRGGILLRFQTDYLENSEHHPLEGALVTIFNVYCMMCCGQDSNPTPPRQQAGTLSFTLMSRVAIRGIVLYSTL